MNTNIYSTIRVAIVFGIAFLASVNSAFAAPVLAPATATRVTENSATIIGHVSNPYKNSTVWFEFYNTNSAPTTYAMQGIWNEGAFEWNLSGLNAGQTYSYRSAAMEGGVTVYSPMSSFTTLTPKPAATVSSVTTPVKIIETATPKTTVVAKNDVTATAKQAEGFTNNSASIIGAGNSMLPNTLAGWILLLIMVLAAVLLGHMIYEHAEKRKVEREKKMKEEENAEAKE